LNVDDGLLREWVELAKVDRESALAKVAGSQLPPDERQGVTMALKGISNFEQNSGDGRSRPYTGQLERIQGGVLLDAIDQAYVRTWLLYAQGLGVVKDEGGVKGEDHEPEEKIRPDSLGVQLSLNAYGIGDEGSGKQDAEKIEHD
jgi:hypothetical protein